MKAAKSVVVMGVSASGKTTIANLLGAELDYRVLDADDLHPAANVEKMRAGIPLDDADRAPWLRKVADWIGEQRAQGVGVVVSCSALRRAYRDVLRQADARIVFVWLDVDRDTLEQRLAHRRGHFMPASLLDDQLETLEPPGEDERAVRVAPSDSAQDTADQAIEALSRMD